MDHPEAWIPWVGSLLALLCLWGALRANRRQRLMDNLPTSKTTGVFIGFVEVKGTAESARPLTSFLAHCACVHYSWSVDEHWSRTVTETYTDSNGKTQTRTRHESGWTNVARGGEQIPFFLRDDCGSLLIRPEGAQLEPAPVFSETVNRGHPLYYGKGPPHAVSNSDHRRRFVEEAIPLQAPLYVLGQARERADVVAAEIAAADQAPMFLISTRPEEAISRGYSWSYWGWLLLGLLLAGAGWTFAARQADWGGIRNLAFLPAVLAGLAYGLAATLGWVWMVFNSLVDLRQRVNQAWSLIDVQLKRRHDLLPNLVQTVTGLRDYERNLQTELAALRAQLAATPPGVAGPDYQGCRPLLLAVAERYPELKSQAAFLDLQKNLADTEQRIALARGYFNEIATYYNTRLEIIPDRFVAALGGLQPRPLLAAADFERAAVAADL